MPEEKDTTRKKNIFLTDEKERDTTSSRRKTERERRDTPSGANQFSVYAQRDTDSTQVDWGVIAKDLTTEVKRISEDRAKRRNDIEVSTQEAMKELSLVADLDNQSVNGFVIRGGNFSKNALQTQMELLRNGAIKPEEYQLFMQQQKDGYANLSLFAKNADDKYKAAMERLKNGEDGNQIASDLEIAFNEGTFDYTDLKNKQLITNPSTGEMLIVTLQEGKDGKMVIPNMKDNPELYQSLATLNNRTAFQLDRRNTGKLTDKIVDNLATVITAEDITTYSIGKGGGGIETIEDFTQLFNEKSRDLDFDTWMQTQIDTVAGQEDDESSMNAAQVLSNTGVKFSLKDEPGTIQYRTNGNGMPELMMTPEQIDQARDIVQKQIESKLIQKIEYTKGMSGQQVSPSKSKANDDKKKEEATNAQNLKMLGNVFRGKDESAVMAGLEHFANISPNVKNIEKTADGLLVTVEVNGKLEPRNITMKGKTFEQFVDSAGNLLTGKDIDKTNMTGGDDTSISAVYGSAGIVKDDEFDTDANALVLDEKINDLDFYEDDEKMQTQIIDRSGGEEGDFPTMNILDKGYDTFEIQVGGYTVPSNTFEGDFNSITGTEEGDAEKQKLKDFMRELYIQKFNKEKEKGKKSSTSPDYSSL